MHSLLALRFLESTFFSTAPPTPQEDLPRLIPVLLLQNTLDVSCLKQGETEAETRLEEGAQGREPSCISSTPILKPLHPRPAPYHHPPTLPIDPTPTPTAGCPLINPWVEGGQGSEVKDAIEDPKDKCCRFRSLQRGPKPGLNPGLPLELSVSVPPLHQPTHPLLHEAKTGHPEILSSWGLHRASYSWGKQVISQPSTPTHTHWDPLQPNPG